MGVGSVVGLVVLVVTAVVAFRRFRHKKGVAASDQVVHTRPRRWRTFTRRDPAMEALISKTKAAAGKLGLEFRDSGGGTMFAMCVCV